MLIREESISHKGSPWRVRYGDEYECNGIIDNAIICRLQIQ